MGIPIIGDIINAAKDIISEVVVDKDKKIEANIKLKELEDKFSQRAHEELMGQIEINKTEATHSSVFVAGWRPFIGWVSGVGVGWQFVVSPLVEWISRLAGWTGTMPELDTGQLMTLVTALLGVGAMRSYEKVNEVARDAIKPPKTKEAPATVVATEAPVRPKGKFKI